jgi:D-tyrosyl-tRNA(Tyr) deacylase
MRVLIQRVTSAAVTIDGNIYSSINQGLLLLLGIESDDNMEDIDWLVKKTCALRIFGDAAGLMNLSIQDIDGDILVVSQFTLFASTKKGNRPSFIRAARPETAIPLYASFVNALRETTGKNIGTGIFGADMKVSLVNDGPVTIWMDSKGKE